VRIISRYFLTSYLKFFAVILFSSTIAIAVIEIMLHFESVLDHSTGPMGFATYLSLRIPSYYFRDLIPVACFAAAFCCIGLPARAHEITAIKSGGISPPRTVIPLLCAAAALSGLTLLFNESVVLRASRAWSREQNPGGEITFRQGSFWYQRGNAIYSVQEADREARVLHGVSVYELSPRGRLLQILHAEQVEVEDERHWRFLDTISRTFDPSRPAQPPRIERVSVWNRDVAAESDLAMLEASARTLSLPKLEAYIDAQARAGRSATRYLALYHSRLSGPLTVFLFALLAVPLGFAVGQSRSLAASALVGIIILAIYYTAHTTARLLAENGLAWAVAGPWLIFAIFSGYGVWQLRRVSR
jgi:lipopolysaccharide export system permease protein